jgi:hypothetical protein
MRFAMAFLLWSFLPWPWGRFGVLKKLTPRGAITHEVSRLKKDFGPAVTKLKNPANNSAADPPFTAPEVAAEVGHWLSHLGAERRMSAKTVDAYQRDVRQFLDFLAMHFGARVTLAGLRDVATPDVRAFMAHRRGQGASGRSLMRSLAGIRSFARFLERQGSGRLGALAAIRAS